MTDITLPGLVQNKTMDERVAALLWTIADEKRGFVTAAVPRKAGKTAVMDAVLQFAPDGTPIHRLRGPIDQIRRLGRKPDGGYLVVGEISKGSQPGYIWGDPVRAVFDSLRAGYSLAATLHASDADDVFRQICEGNRIAAADASKVQYVVFIERFGESDDTFWRRVAGVYETDGADDGRPRARQLQRWSEASSRLVQVAAPRLLSAHAETLRRRARLIREMADTGRTSREDVRSLIAPAPRQGTR